MAQPTTCAQKEEITLLATPGLTDARILVLLDLHMPKLDGFAVMKLLEDRISSDTFLPILILTADIRPEIKRRALSAGAKDSSPSRSTGPRCCCGSRTCWRRGSCTCACATTRSRRGRRPNVEQQMWRR